MYVKQISPIKYDSFGEETPKLYERQITIGESKRECSGFPFRLIENIEI